MSKEKKEFALLFVLYSLVIIAALWWSGYVTSPSVYDRYLTRLEGVSIQVKDLERSRDLLKRVLNYQPLKEGGDILLLPDRRKLYLKQNANPSPSELVLRVRNGFPKLFDEMRKRLGPTTTVPGRAQISDMTPTPSGDEFILTDYDGNRFVYFRPKRKSLTRESITRGG